MQGVEQKNGDECDREGHHAAAQRKQNNLPDKSEHPPPSGLARLARHLLQRFPLRHRIPVSGRRPAGKFDCFGNLTKALTFSPERAACVAECRVSEYPGLIHALDVGQDHGPQQQSTLFDQRGHFREVQSGIAQGLRGALLGGLGRVRILRVHLRHGLFQGCHVIDHLLAAARAVLRTNPRELSADAGSARTTIFFIWSAVALMHSSLLAERGTSRSTLAANADGFAARASPHGQKNGLFAAPKRAEPNLGPIPVVGKGAPILAAFIVSLR